MRCLQTILILALAVAPLTPQTASPSFTPQPAAPRLRPLPPVSKDVVSGPAVGARVPAFQLPDQTGRPRDLRSLTGRNGLLLAFVRSADW